MVAASLTEPPARFNPSATSGRGQKPETAPALVPPTQSEVESGNPTTTEVLQDKEGYTSGETAPDATPEQPKHGRRRRIARQRRLMILIVAATLWLLLIGVFVKFLIDELS